MKGLQNSVASQRARRVMVVLLAGAGLASGASAQLTIARVDQGGTPPANLAGGGTLDQLFNAAADWWEYTMCDSDPHTVTIRYRWGGLGNGILGVHTLLQQGGSPNRETLGSITLTNATSTSFWADPTPTDPSEYTVFAPIERDLGGGTINTARFYRSPTGLPDGRIDLFSTVLHEIGHALGLSSANMSFQSEVAGDDEIDVTAPRPFAGTIIPTTPGSAHLNVFRALMFPSIGPSSRSVVAGVDVLTNAQLSRWNSPTLEAPVDAAATARNGTGVNPTGYTQVTPCVIGTTWSTEVDLSNGASLSVLFAGFGGPTQQSTQYGELLVAAPHRTLSIRAGVHDHNIPYDCTLVGRDISTQATTLGPPPAQLQNAIDLVVGAF